MDSGQVFSNEALEVHAFQMTHARLQVLKQINSKHELPTDWPDYIIEAINKSNDRIYSILLPKPDGVSEVEIRLMHDQGLADKNTIIQPNDWLVLLEGRRIMHVFHDLEYRDLFHDKVRDPYPRTTEPLFTYFNRD